MLILELFWNNLGIILNNAGIIKSFTYLNSNMETRWQATMYFSYFKCKFHLLSLELTLISAFKLCKSHKHLLERIRVCVVTFALTSTIAIPVEMWSQFSALSTLSSGQGCTSFASIIFEEIGRQTAKRKMLASLKQIQAKCTQLATIAMLKMCYSNIE